MLQGVVAVAGGQDRAQHDLGYIKATAGVAPAESLQAAPSHHRQHF